MKLFDVEIDSPRAILKSKKLFLGLLVLVFIIIAAIVVPTAVVLSRKSNNADSIQPPPTWGFAQTHILPPQGKSWTLKGTTTRYHLVGGRQTLLLVNFDAQGLETDGTSNPTADLYLPVYQQPTNLTDMKLVATIPLSPPSMLPPTESNGTRLSNSIYSATIPAQWMKPGLRVTAKTGKGQSVSTNVLVGETVNMNLKTLPFYLFGANDTNSYPFNTVKVPPADHLQELAQKWPVSSINAINHQVGRIDWPYMIIGPRSGGPPYRVNNINELKDGFAVMAAVLGVLGSLRSVNGEGLERTQYYAPLFQLNNKGTYSGPGGGLGGGSSGTGDFSYTGIFIHEQGHAFGLPHTGESYASGNFPYKDGSLLGSEWGFDFNHWEFLPPWIPSNSSDYKNCKNDGRVLDSEGRCQKQDVMQGGSGTQAKGYIYAMFPDFDMGVMQYYFEGYTTADASGTHSIKGGSRIYNANNNTYSSWDSIYSKYVPYTIANETNGLYGMDSGTPIKRNVPVYGIYITYSRANVTNVTQIYPYLQYTGNIRRYIDPTNPSDLAQIVPNTGNLAWFCHSSGCDFTIRVTYVDNSQITMLMQTGVRTWFHPFDPPTASTTDPLSGDSFFTFMVNVPATQAIKTTELLWTPFGFNGFNNTVVLVSR